MAKKNKLWLWNILAVITVIVCILALLAHFKNWTKVKPDHVRILSGFYYKEIRYDDLDSVLMVDRIPPMIRLNGFSAFDKGKGIYREFKDSLTDKEVYVFVDNFTNQKIRLVKKDATQLFVNLKDSVETEELFQHFQAQLNDKGLTDQ